MSAKVYEKIFLDLQQDEVELSQETFKKLFYQLIEIYQSAPEDLNLEKIMQTDDISQNEIITDLVMKEEQHQLHDWEKRNIFVKNKGTEVVRMVSETILSMRRYLIDQKIVELQLNTKEQGENQETLQEIISWQQLKKVVSNKLNRVL
jgi:DNA primase